MKIKKTLVSMVLSAVMALAPATAKAMDSSGREDLRYGRPEHIQWIFDNKDKARAISLGVNVAFNCLKSGVGSKLNDGGFFSGCAKGALGGSVMFAGEYIASYNSYPMIGASGKLVHDLGVSMSDNVMRGEGLFSQYETEFGPVTFTFKGSLVPDLSFTATPTYAVISNVLDKQEFDARRSLYNFTPVFRRRYVPESRFGGHEERTVMPASTRGNVISYTDMSKSGYSDWYNKYTFSHEMNHVLFWSKSRSMKHLVNKLPSEGVHPALEMEKIQRWWNIGQDLGGNIQYMPMYLNPKLYYYVLPEMNAYIMAQE